MTFFLVIDNRHVVREKVVSRGKVGQIVFLIESAKQPTTRNLHETSVVSLNMDCLLEALVYSRLQIQYY